jgi:hypothetical protein
VILFHQPGDGVPAAEIVGQVVHLVVKDVQQVLENDQRQDIVRKQYIIVGRRAQDSQLAPFAIHPPNIEISPISLNSTINLHI